MSIDQPVVVTRISATDAIALCIEHAAGSVLIDKLIELNLLNEYQRILMVTVGAPPKDVPYSAPTGTRMHSPEEWLVDAIVNYLQSLPDSMVILEDSNSSPDDPYLLQQSHPVYFCFRNTVLWPLVGSSVSHAAVAQAISWAKGWREVIAFSAIPIGVNGGGFRIALTDNQVSQIAKSATTFIIDVFRGEGYLVFEKSSAP